MVLDSAAPLVMAKRIECYDCSFIMLLILFLLFFRFYRYFFDFAIVVNAVIIAVSLDEAEWFFLALFTLEILLNLYVYGPWNFIKSFWNV